jgi:protein-tyrosine phosphatase
MRKLEPRGRNDGHTFDFSQITEDIFIGSDLCKGGVCPIHSEQFKALGVCVELNLTAEKKEIPPDDMDLYAWLPVIDGYAPSIDQLDLGTSVISQAIESGKKVYVHCTNGHGRSPTMVAAYLIRFKNYSVKKAIDWIMQNRPEIHIENTQMKALKEFSKKWSQAGK